MITLIALIILFILIGGGMWLWPLLAGILGISSVTDKAGALRHIQQLIQSYEITPAEVEMTFRQQIANNERLTQRSKNGIAKTLFSYLGAILIFAGIGTYIGMHWGNMGSAMRILLTLGVAYILLIVLISALYEKKFLQAILPLTLASVFMMVGGWLVLLEEMYPNSELRTVMLFISGAMTLHWAVLFSKYQRVAFALITLFFVYVFMHVSLDMLGIPPTYIAITLGSSLFLVGAALVKTSKRLLAEPAILIGSIWLNGGLFDLIARFNNAEWASLVVGVSLMVTAYGLNRENRYPRLIGLGYLVGSTMLYAVLFQLVENSSIELIYLAVTTSLLYACVALQSRALLLTTVLSMLSYIGYFSAKHFAGSLSWPITLVLMGIAFLGIGAIALKLKRQL